MIRRLLIPLVLAACGGHAPPPPTFARAAALPPEVSVVIGFDAAKLKATPFWGKVGTKVTSLLGRHERRDLDELRRLCDLDPLRDVRWAVVAVDARGRIDDAVLIVNGNWNEQKVDRCAAAFRAKDDDRAARQRRPARSRDELALLGQSVPDPAPPPVAMPPSDDADNESTFGFKHYGDAWFAWLAPDTAAIAFKRRSLPFLKRVVDNKSGSENAALKRHLQRIDPNATLWFAGVRTNDDIDLDDLDPFDTDVMKHAAGASLSIVLGTEVHARFVAEQPTAEKVAELTASMDKRFHRKLREVPMLDKVKVTANGVQVEAALDVDASTLDFLAGLIVNEADRKAARRDDDDDIPPPPTPESDRDGDGVPDYADKCPDEPEDKDGFQDDDGCPEPDNDQDGIPDAADRCPSQAEDRNGFRDDDGCPDDAEYRAMQAKQTADKADREKQARSRSEQGRAFLDAGVYDKALEEFRAAYALVPLPKLQYNMAVAYDKMKDRANAIEMYKKYVDAEPDDPLAKDARKRIAELTRDLKKSK